MTRLVEHLERGGIGDLIRCGASARSRPPTDTNGETCFRTRLTRLSGEDRSRRASSWSSKKSGGGTKWKEVAHTHWNPKRLRVKKHQFPLQTNTYKYCWIATGSLARTKSRTNSPPSSGPSQTLFSPEVSLFNDLIARLPMVAPESNRACCK